MKDIPGFEGYYQISPSGEIWSLISKKLIKTHFHSRCPYLKTSLYVDGKRVQDAVIG